jgi:signal transduction histidine kinase
MSEGDKDIRLFGQRAGGMLPAGKTLLLIAILLLVAMVNAATAGPKRVLFLHSFGRDFSPWAEFTRSFRTDLDQRSPDPIEFFDAALMTDRFGVNQDESPFTDYLTTLFKKRELDLIVAIGAPAARFVQQHRPQLFLSTPMLFTGVEQRRVPLSTLSANDTVVATTSDHAAVIKNILAVLPDTAKIAVVIGTSPNEQYWLGQLRSAFQPFTDRVAFTWFNDLSFDDMLKRSAALPPRSAIVFFSLLVDAAGRSHEGEKSFATLRAGASAPIFTHIDTKFGNGVVGGPFYSTNNTAERAASAAVRILSGEAPSNIKTPPVGFGTPKFDWRELQRWNIAESRLPPGSEVHFRALTMWEQYRIQLLGICAALLAQAALISWLLYERRRRSLAEARSHNAMGELANMNRLATAGQLSASIAHEINQPVTGIMLKASAALRWLAVDKPDMDRIRTVLADIVGAAERAGEIINSVRAMFKKEGHAKVRINLNNLINTVLVLLRVDLQKDDVRVEAQLEEQLPDVTGDPVQLQQVILNLVVNAADAMRAVQPRVLKVQTNRSPSGMVHVSIEDTGTGISAPDRDRIFNPLFTTKTGGMGMGLSICRSIIENHGGRLWVAAAASRGAIFKFELPSADSRTASRDLAA